jgi:predicted RNase H-like HicB family nuclease
MSCKFTVVIQKEEDWYVARCVENGVASQGRDIEDSITNLKEAIELYYEDNEPEVFASPAFVTTLEVAV